MHWKEIREKNKPRDRFYRVYDNPESFWTTLDAKVVAWTYEFGPSGILFRILYAILGISNRYEPMPIGNKSEINNLWSRWPPWIRYLLWRVRNPWEDLRKFYLGFAYARDIKTYQVSKHFKFWLARFRWIPFRIPFPYYKKQNFLEIMIGWKSRGILSVTIRKND